MRNKSVDLLEAQMKDDLHCTIKWMRENKLSLNLNKTQCMMIGSAQRLSKCRELNLNINYFHIESVHCAKLLGVFVDRCLSCKDHIDYVSKKVSKRLVF